MTSTDNVVGYIMPSTDRVGVYYDLYRQSEGYMMTSTDRVEVYYDLCGQSGVYNTTSIDRMVWYIMTSIDRVKGIL